MKKHIRASLALVVYTKEGKQVQISYSDNGVGLKNKLPITKGGLSNAENRIAAIKGTFTFDAKGLNGFKSYVAFPA